MIDPSNYILPEDDFEFLLKKECDRAERYANFFSILLVKLESPVLEDSLFFDTANQVRGLIRDSDILGTVQGKKLAAILHHADSQNTDEIAGRVWGRLKEYSHRPPGPLGGHRIKVGAACFPTHAPTAQDLLRAAQERFLKTDANPE